MYLYEVGVVFIFLFWPQLVYKVTCFPSIVILLSQVFADTPFKRSPLYKNLFKTVTRGDLTHTAPNVCLPMETAPATRVFSKSCSEVIARRSEMGSAVNSTCCWGAPWARLVWDAFSIFTDLRPGSMWSARLCTYSRAPRCVSQSLLYIFPRPNMWPPHPAVDITIKIKHVKLVLS